MGKIAKFKFAVEIEERRSATWTVAIHKNEIYVSSTISKQDKVSLHQSGIGQWSMRSEVVDKAPFVPELGRHFARWRDGGVAAGDSTKLFFVLMAEAELRVDRPPLADNVVRLKSPQPGEGTYLGFYVIPNPLRGNLTHVEPTPRFVHQMPDKRILILADQLTPITPDTTAKISAVRDFALSEASLKGITHRGMKVIARITDASGVSGLVEVSPLLTQERN